MKHWRVWIVTGSLLCLPLVALLISTGCTTTETTAAGALLGGGTGAIVGHQSGETAAGAGIGAAVGALGGYIVGTEKEKKEMREGIAAANTRVVRVYSPDGKSFREVLLQRHPSGWINPATGRVYQTEPTAEDLRKEGY